MSIKKLTTSMTTGMVSGTFGSKTHKRGWSSVIKFIAPTMCKTYGNRPDSLHVLFEAPEILDKLPQGMYDKVLDNNFLDHKKHLEVSKLTSSAVSQATMAAVQALNSQDIQLPSKQETLLNSATNIARTIRLRDRLIGRKKGDIHSTKDMETRYNKKTGVLILEDPSQLAIWAKSMQEFATDHDIPNLAAKIPKPSNEDAALKEWKLNQTEVNKIETGTVKDVSERILSNNKDSSWIVEARLDKELYSLMIDSIHDVNPFIKAVANIQTQIKTITTDTITPDQKLAQCMLLLLPESLGLVQAKIFAEGTNTPKYAEIQLMAHSKARRLIQNEQEQAITEAKYT
ncbi:hypothetical protein BDR26DRAFT_965755 [Obelidium mucronatum]|nr:hypothetical protein BDR26DRAFT_965755 [Obelidium mucronatum]